MCRSILPSIRSVPFVAGLRRRASRRSRFRKRCGRRTRRVKPASSTRPPAWARHWPRRSGRSCWGPRSRRAAAARAALADAAARARDRYRPRAPARRAALNPHWTVGVRTGDTSASARARRSAPAHRARDHAREPHAAAVRADWRERFAHLAAVVVDEWHELLGSKRGVQVELALARLRGCIRRCDVGPVGDARQPRRSAALPRRARTEAGARRSRPRYEEIEIASALPETVERFPWAGHLGLAMCPRSSVPSIRALDAGVHQHALGDGDVVPGDPRGAARLGRPDRAASRLARRDVRDWVEEGLRDGR